MLTVTIAAGRDGFSFVPGLSAWSLLARLPSGEGTPSLFSSLLRSDEPGAPPTADAEVAQAFRSHSRRTITAGTPNPRCPATPAGPTHMTWRPCGATIHPLRY
jgi:hypothetical protein